MTPEATPQRSADQRQDHVQLSDATFGQSLQVLVAALLGGVIPGRISFRDGFYNGCTIWFYNGFTMAILLKRWEVRGLPSGVINHGWLEMTKNCWWLPSSIIKHGWLENGPFSSVIFLFKRPLIGDFPLLWLITGADHWSFESAHGQQDMKNKKLNTRRLRCQ